MLIIHSMKMANKYVDAIASSLEEFQNTDFLNFISDKQVFIDMAWWLTGYRCF
jgi:hypothetical protein